MAKSSLALFAVLGVAVSIVLGKLHHTNEELSRTKDALRLSNENLADHTDALSRSNLSTVSDFCIERSRSKSDHELTKALTTVVTSAKRMSRLIADLLTLAKIDHDQVTPQAEVDAGRVAKLALLNLRKEIDSSGAKISLEPLPVLYAHEAQLVQLFQNLVSNSIKYRNGNLPTIQISATQEDHEWRFSVSDNGIGIDPKYPPKSSNHFRDYTVRRSTMEAG
jgi:chemotaxis family two-component system sensor kinase Cph1